MKHIATPRLLMRPFTADDFQDLYTLYNNPEVMKYITGGKPRTTEETAKALERMISRFEESGYGMFAVIERREKRFIGRCGLQPLENSGLIELGYTFIPSAWGKGYATESSLQVLRSAFNEWDLDKIVAIAKEENKASTRVMEKIGMVYSERSTFYNTEVVLYTIEKPQKILDNIFQKSFQNSSTLVFESISRG
jgi:ribosomal-protein-alanine N-acetyltransferase